MLGQRDRLRWQAGESLRGQDTVVAETTFGLVLDGVELLRAVVSPAQLAEWGAGYAICEGLLPKGEIAGVKVEEGSVHISSRGGVGDGWAKRACPLVQRSSGYLGRPAEDGLPPLVSGLRVSPRQIEAWARALSEEAPGWRQTGGLHVALLYGERGELVSVCEDIGRHNALDKAIGAAHLGGVDLSRCAVVISGRMPQGMVVKVVRAGVPVAITKAASTDMGIDIARKYHLTLICFARPGRFTVYSGEDRILL